MRLIFHGELKKLYGDSVNMASSTIADAMEGFSRQKDNWPRDLMVQVVGHSTVESLQEGPDEVHLMPAMRGGGGKFGSIILGVVLVAVAVLAPEIGGFIAANAFAIGFAGGLMILQGVVSLFTKAPTIKSSNDPTASNYLGLNVNTTANNTPITMAWGTIDLAGQWLSLNSTSSNLAYGTFPATPS